MAVDAVGETTASPGTPGEASAAAASKPATIYDVARAAGVSHQTVSRYLKGYKGIRPQTQEKVAKALAELQYRPNLTARSLKSGRPHRLAALTHELEQVGPSRIVQGASAAARQAGYLLDIITFDMTDADAVDEAVRLAASQDVAGILALASTDAMTEVFERTDFRVPAHIAAEEDDEVTGHRTELSDIGFPSLIAYLAGLGHEAFLHIAGPPDYSASRNRARAYERALGDQGLVSAGTIHGDWSAKSGYDVVMARGRDLGATAIVAANDQTALGAMLALRELGLRVPEDVSVTGVDDIPEAAYFAPPLTTLRVDFAAQGRSAVQELLSRIDQAPPPRVPSLQTELVVRSSTAWAPGR
ncbi:LacI family DNA-binding transcriptional regulator [Glycomyces luteolus]|uniref:LacI family DNA-binding transcriptional regulator n=1 Tax=Glycomyces luteolus TaxID=2670330 RepID=A0A9X3P903_9ACTN|nr:LacI family DNA-binding transcriptional regulator [Glycomyces luteolus]MDA1361023.1 LacI family DNA-binding transcriptional regulator [Glycomyces luteolus]